MHLHAWLGPHACVVFLCFFVIVIVFYSNTKRWILRHLSCCDFIILTLSFSRSDFCGDLCLSRGHWKLKCTHVFLLLFIHVGSYLSWFPNLMHVCYHVFPSIYLLEHDYLEPSNFVEHPCGIIIVDVRYQTFLLCCVCDCFFGVLHFARDFTSHKGVKDLWQEKESWVPSLTLMFNIHVFCSPPNRSINLERLDVFNTCCIHGNTWFSCQCWCHAYPLCLKNILHHVRLL
jgi:hypothetical protein